MTDEKDPRIEKMQQQLEDIKKDLSMLRKKGKETIIAQLKIMRIPAKIKMAEGTMEEKDFQTAKNFITDAINELNELGLRELKKEDHPEHTLEFAKQRCEQAKQAISQNNKDMAKQLYSQIREIFANLNADEKKQIYNDCVQIAKQL